MDPPKCEVELGYAMCYLLVKPRCRAWGFFVHSPNLCVTNLMCNSVTKFENGYHDWNIMGVSTKLITVRVKTTSATSNGNGSLVFSFFCVPRESPLILDHGICVSVWMCDLPVLHPGAMDGCIEFLISCVFAVLIELGTVHCSSFWPWNSNTRNLANSSGMYN